MVGRTEGPEKKVIQIWSCYIPLEAHFDADFRLCSVLNQCCNTCIATELLNDFGNGLVLYQSCSTVLS